MMKSLNVHDVLVSYLLQCSDRFFRIEGLEGCPLLWNLNLNNNFIERRELGWYKIRRTHQRRIDSPIQAYAILPVLISRAQISWYAVVCNGVYGLMNRWVDGRMHAWLDGCMCVCNVLSCHFISRNAM